MNGDTTTGNVKSDFFRNINTIILTIIGVLATIITISVNDIRNRQIRVGEEMVRIKTIQDENTLKINTHLLINISEDIKGWVDQNYVRKPQK